MPSSPGPEADPRPSATTSLAGADPAGGLAAVLDRFAGAFAATSGLLGAAPTAALLDRMRDADVLADWPFAQNAECARGVGLLLESAAAGEDETAIRRDYNRLFFGPGPMIAPPYESVHRSDEHLVFEHETLEVRAAYASFGLAAPRLHKEPDDHLALELGFLAALCVRALDAIDGAHDAELARVLAGIQSFLADHLLTWAPDCLAQAAGGAQTLFYRGVAALGAGILEQAAETAFLPRR